MYRHILVPVDGTELSIGNVTAAVEFARSLGARITFFHANADYASTEAGALMHAMSPAAFADQAAGQTGAILAKAEAAGRAAGVSCGGVWTVSDQPADAILAAADSEGCDLVFMASREPASIGSIMLGSQTLKVLAGAKIPVLVSQVARNTPQNARDSALSMIRDEHRSIAAVLHALGLLLGQSSPEGRSPDFRILRGAIYYLRAFPETLHHPKEEEFLFSGLRVRAPELTQTLDDLEREHAAGAAQLQRLADAVEAYALNPASAPVALREAYEAFAVAQRQHIATEERIVLPAAAQLLTGEDWNRIAEAFGRNVDPRFDRDVDTDFRKLFNRLMTLTA